MKKIMKKITISRLWLLSCGFCFVLTASSSPSLAITEVARVNDKVISLEQVTAQMLEDAKIGAPGATSSKIALEEIIKREAAIQEAKKIKLDQDPVIVERMNEVLFLGFLERKIGADYNKFTISDSETKNYYEKNPQIRTSHIYIAVSPNAPDELFQKATAKLKEIAGEIKSGKMSFAEAAQKNSEDPSAIVGGDLDYRMKDRLEAAYYQAALKLKIGQVSEPVRTNFGMHLIRLTAKQSWSRVDHVHIKRIIAEEKRAELSNKVLSELRQKAKVSINEKALP